MSEHNATGTTALPNPGSPRQSADWTVIRVLHHYRLLLVVAFAAAFYLADGLGLLGSRHFDLFKYTHLGYLFVAIVFGHLIRRRWPSLETQFYLQAYVDLVVLSTLIYASGGIGSGLAILLVLHIAVISHYLPLHYAMLFASLTTSLLLSQELYARFIYGNSAVNFTQTALLCMVLFGVALLASMTRSSRQISLTPPQDQALSFRQISRLNQRIIQELESGVLFVDANNRVQIINTRAQEWLYGHPTTLPISIKNLCEPLYSELRRWRRNKSGGNRSMTSPVGHKELLPNFIDLGNGGTLIRIEDQQKINSQVQQLKLASLGRLSASIAHEIRNPLHAINHAVQLLSESTRLSDTDRRLIDIATTQSSRINRIVEDVLHMASRQEPNINTINLASHLQRFRQEFLQQQTLEEQDLVLEIDDSLNIYFDAIHFDQLLWNICTNSLVHNPDIPVKIHIAAYLRNDGTIVVDIEDNGAGIPEEQQQWMFEPFFTTQAGGTGLGLYIIRELCELNRGEINYLNSEYGACFRLTIPQAQRMAA